jgi:hypothetical protein
MAVELFFQSVRCARTLIAIRGFKSRVVREIELGSEGLEPSPVRLRAGCAAANTSIPRL